jgi:hypothetical protein
MLAVAGIYGLGVLLCLVAGVSLRAILDPRGRWVGVDVLPAGLCTLIILLYLFGTVMPSSGATPAALAVVVAALVVAVVLRLRPPEGAGTAGGGGSPLAALRPTLPETIATVLGIAAGLVLLIPVMHQGFPTTIAVTNNDGWGYAGMIDWLKDHPFPRDVTPDIAHPLTFIPWNTGGNGFGFGFEHVGAMLATILGRDGFEVASAVAAVAFAGAVGGWALLLSLVRGRLGTAEATLVVAAVASPVLILPYAENYATQFVSLCLWPFAVAAFARFAKEPGWRHLVMAAVGSAALVGVYPGMTPWLALPLVAVALLAPARPEWSATRLKRVAGGGAGPRVGRAVVLLGALVVSVAVIGAVQSWRAIDNLRTLDEAVVDIGDFFSARAYATFFTGAQSAFELFPRGRSPGRRSSP